MATRTRASDIETLREKIRDAVHRIVDGNVKVSVGWLGKSPDEEEILVQVILPEPGGDETWGQEMANAIRAAVRATTADVLPSAVATTRLVSEGDDGDNG